MHIADYFFIYVQFC